MFKRLKQLLNPVLNPALATSAAPAPFSGADPAPDCPVYAVGDLHGRADLLERAFEAIDRDAAGQGLDAFHIVFLGDYIDRGEQSDAVLAQLRGFVEQLPDWVVCLMGNHEKMMLDFLDRPEERGDRWLRNGGLQTLASYRIGGITERASPPEMIAASDRLRAALPEGTEAWLRGLPLIWQSGNLACVHAGAEPGQPLDDQDPNVLLWGHRDFLGRDRTDGVWVAHGHTVMEAARAERGRISLDTGAYFSNRLSVGVIRTGAPVRLLEVG
ncbi:metallophosphoesterase family protein [Brevirhabdus sp.]|uniref:metallophosphoesterase family protein n=1 Tax=Brevirhabdus sp. TaxID=2004514 RepID=UPI0040597091